jgi:peptidyl-prolyl cis-trans isomerase B (cyclophilin B)
MKVILYDQTPQHKANFLKLAKNGDYDSTIFHRVIEGFMIQGGDLSTKPGVEKDADYKIPAEFIDTLFHHKGALAAARQGDNTNPTKASSGSQWYIVQGKVFSKEELTSDLGKINSYLMKLIEKPEYGNLREELSKIYYEEGEAAFNKKLVEMKPILEEEFDEKFDNQVAADRLEKYSTIGGAYHLDDEYTVFGRVVEGLGVIDKIAAVKTGMRDKPVDEVYMTVEVETMSAKKLKKLYGNK